jgi:hypothetical protein
MLRLAHPNNPREFEPKKSAETKASEQLEKLVEAKLEQVAERIAAVEVAIKDHQVIQKDNSLPAPTNFRSERNKKRIATRATKKPKLVPYPLPSSWTESLHETQAKAKMDTRFVEKKKTVVIERLPETTNHETVVKSVLDHPNFKNKDKFRSANRLGNTTTETAS